MALGVAVQPLGERVGLLELAAARARLLHRSVARTYPLIALLVAVDATLRLDAAVALPAALDLDLVCADDPRATAACEALVRPLPTLVAELKELGQLRLLLVGLLAAFVITAALLCLAVLLVLLRVVAAVGQELVLLVG